MNRTIRTPAKTKQHFYGELHNQATLAYLIAREKFKNRNGKEYTGARNDFPFDNYRDDIQMNMRNSFKILIQPTKDNFELYFKEIYYSCYYKPYWNTFETH